MLNAHDCDLCGLSWAECRCTPAAPVQSTREMAGDAPVILIDQREQAPLRFKSATECVLLTCGDYSLRGLSAEIAIERKSLPDLVSCCGKDRVRFIEQIERMRQYRFRALVLETSYSCVTIGAYRSQINPLSVLGTLVKIAQDIHIPVWFAEDAAGAAQLVERMLLREYRKVRRK